jgi:hypothetical protein
LCVDFSGAIITGRDPVQYFVVVAVIAIGIPGAVMLLLSRQKTQRARRVREEPFNMAQRLERVLNGSVKTQEADQPKD